MKQRFAALLLILSGGMAAGCMPQVQPHIPPAGEPALKQAIFAPGDGSELMLKRWPSHDRPPKAVIIAVHGFNDYSNAFFFPASYWAERGITTYAYDQRGFGTSQPVGVWGGRKNLSSDLRQITHAVKALHPGIPLYLLGESMGGAVVIVTMTEPEAPEVDGIILSAPAVWGGSAMNPIYRMTLWLSAHTIPGHKLTGEHLDIQASDNIAMLIELVNDPLVIKETRIDAIYGLVKLMDAAYGRGRDLRVPMLLLYGEHDQIIPDDSIQGFRQTLRNPYTFIHYPAGWHMLLRDMQAQAVWRDVADWVRGIVPDTAQDDIL